MDAHINKNINKLINIVLYIVGLLFLFSGLLLTFGSMFLTGLFFILIGIILTPAIADPIEKKLNVSLPVSLRFIVVGVLFIVGLVAVGTVQPIGNVSSNSIGSEGLQVNNTTLSVVEPESDEVKDNNTTTNSSEPIPTPTPTPVPTPTQVVEPTPEPTPTPTPIPTPTSSPGKLEILTNPSGASITIDGVSKGESPIEGLKIESGTHAVTVYLSGYNPQQEKVEIGNSETKMLSYTLVPETKPSQASTPNQENKESNPEPAANETEPTANYQDAQWLAMASQYSPIIGDDMTKVSEAASNYDYVSLSNSGSALYYDSLAAIEESNKYEVSSALQPTKDEFEDALHYSQEAGSNIVSGIYDVNQGRTDEGKKYINTAIENTDECNEHMKTAFSLLNEYQSNLK